MEHNQNDQGSLEANFTLSLLKKLHHSVKHTVNLIKICKKHWTE